MAAVTYESLVREIQSGKFRPVYYLMGEESYYLDRLTDLLSTAVLDEAEREFNQLTIYGQDATIDAIIANARRFPMMANHVVIIVKEAQNIKEIDKLSLYLQKPQPSTVLVFSHKNGSLNKKTHKSLLAEIDAAGGAVFESNAIKNDTILIAFIDDYLAAKGRTIDGKARMMLVEAVGANLSRMASEMDKLVVNTTEENRHVTPEMVEAFTGISKEYNIFELQKALVNKDIQKANRIAKFMDDNPKAHPSQAVFAFLFNYFSRLMLAYYAPQRDSAGVAKFLNVGYYVDDYLRGMRNYSAFKVMEIISALRRYDGMSKGVGARANITSGGLIRELVHFILH
ncbi:MAG: DNA polymerase III subunit delta [Bacteroidaceae bacterium]|nr:DNA polymerase III subunit delta [Bacteroidaceae bacterium]